MRRLTERIKAALSEPRRRVFIAVGAIVTGMLTWNEGPGEDVITAIAVAIACAALVAHELDQSWWKKTPPWARRPRAGSIAAAVFVVSYILNAGFSFGALLFLIGTMIFLYDARERDELTPFDPGRFTRGRSRRVLLAGVLIACFSLSAAWLGDFSSYYAYESSGYTFTGNIEMPSSDAHEVNDALIPVLLLLGLVGVVGYTGKAPAWWRLTPAVLGAAMAVYGIVKMIQNSQHVEEVSQGGVSIPAEGPWLFVLGSALVMGGALFSARGEPQEVPAPDERAD